MRKSAGSDHAYLVRHFKRRQLATRNGLHLPSEDELLLGMGFLNGDIFADAKETCSRWLSKVRGSQCQRELSNIEVCLESVSVAPDPTGILLLANATFDAIHDHSGRRIRNDRGDLLENLNMRCRLYLAHLEFPGAAREIAIEAASRLTQTEQDYYKYTIDFAWSALAWSLFATMCESKNEGSTFTSLEYKSPINSNSSLRLHVEEVIEDGLRRRSADEKQRNAALRQKSLDDKTAVVDQTPPAGFKTVLKDIGNPDLTEGRKVAAAFKSICGVALPLVAVPDLEAISKVLNSEAPHAAAVTRDILNGLLGRTHVTIPPTVLVGKPGTGKTRYARRLFELLGVSHQVISCGGVADGNWAGTARRWSTGEPSLALSALLRTKTANPAIILDEIEKVGSDRHNGNATEALLAMLEPETAIRFVDPFVQGECDLSEISWMMTANSLEGVGIPFRDRCQVLQFPQPERRHAERLANVLLKEVTVGSAEKNWPVDGISGAELEQVQRLWRGGSLRRLKKIVAAIARARLLSRITH